MTGKKRIREKTESDRTRPNRPVAHKTGLDKSLVEKVVVGRVPQGDCRKQGDSSQQESEGVLNRTFLRDNSPLFTWGARTGLFLFLFWFWTIRLADFLYIAQYHDLFLWNVSYFMDCSHRIAGPLFYLTSMGIQSFYYPLIGGGLIALMLSGLELMIARFFHLKRVGALLSFVPPLLLTVSITQVNYYLFDAFDIAFLFAMIPGCFTLFVLCCCYQVITTPCWRLTCFIVGTFLLYPILGFYSLFAALLCLIYEGNEALDKGWDVPDTQRKFRLEISFLSLLLVPLFWYLLYKNLIPFSRLFFAGLMEESVIEKDASTQFFFYLPFWGTLFYLLLLGLGNMFFHYCLQKKNKKIIIKTKGTKEESTVCTRPDLRFHFREILLSGVVILMGYGVVCYSFFPNNFKILLKTARLLDEGRWNDIIDTEKAVPYLPVNPLISARFLSLVRTHQVGDRLFERPLEPKLSIQLKTVSSMMMLGDRILYEHGQVNLATRSAMNNLSDRNGRSVWPIKTLALSAMVSNERELAKRYLDLLDQTLFYCNWSKLYRTWLEHDEKEPMPESVRTINEKILEIRNRMGKVDYFSKTKAVDYAVMEHYGSYDFASSSRDSMITQLMIRLLVSDLNGFLDKVDIFLKKNGDDSVPRHIQEALLFDSWFVKKKGIEETRCRYSPEIVERFRKFTSALSGMGARPTAEQISILEHDYSDTAWFHLAFLKQIEIY